MPTKRILEKYLSVTWHSWCAKRGVNRYVERIRKTLLGCAGHRAALLAPVASSLNPWKKMLGNITGYWTSLKPTTFSTFSTTAVGTLKIRRTKFPNSVRVWVTLAGHWNPKSDNDLPFTDTCPGFGSGQVCGHVDKEAALDVESMFESRQRFFFRGHGAPLAGLLRQGRWLKRVPMMRPTSFCCPRWHLTNAHFWPR